MSHRGDTIKEYREKINRVLIFIQENIERSLRVDELATVACLSPYHFHRIFRAFVGEPLYEYIRRVRLEHGAVKLLHTSASVTEIATSSGYDSPASFTRAFGQYFGMSPSEFRKRRVSYRETPPYNVTEIPEKEVKAMKVDFRKIPEQRVLFVRRTGRYDRAASEAWAVLMKFAYSRKLMRKDTKMIGISHDSPEITPEDRLRYDACITVEGDIEPEGEVGVQRIPGGRYAVFLHRGSYERLDETYRYIFSVWLAESGEKLRETPVFEVYLNRDPRRTKPENLRTEIWVPVEG